MLCSLAGKTMGRARFFYPQSRSRQSRIPLQGFFSGAQIFDQFFFLLIYLPDFSTRKLVPSQLYVHRQYMHILLQSAVCVRVCTRMRARARACLCEHEHACQALSLSLSLSLCLSVSLSLSLSLPPPTQIHSLVMRARAQAHVGVCVCVCSERARARACACT